ncbi:MAG: RdgB/HAM1 family non-canonical purine NTP pyrophosphatase [Candidatus Hydrogenedentes bacterium]|nr:RdgB/HAM1 family non-canonical purine NTP pyrophosphatase [Candidatus Hydrogenedentota bacterium]
MQNTRTLLIATGNRDKAAEWIALLSGLPWEIRSLADFLTMAAPVEDGATFEDNALLKARHYCRKFAMPCLADDSGLVVDALDGAPGVHSARYAGEAGNYSANNEKLLNALAGVPDAERSARFVCCAALAEPDGHNHVEIGTVEGRIALGSGGRHGFGYDPIFIPDGYQETFGELDPAVKQRISHRAEAFRKMREYLLSQA